MTITFKKGRGGEGGKKVLKSKLLPTKKKQNKQQSLAIANLKLQPMAVPTKLLLTRHIIINQ